MSSFHFAEPEYFSWLIILPIYWVFNTFWQNRKKKRLQLAFGYKNYEFLSSSWDMKAAKKRLYLELFMICMFILALARPQSPGGTQVIRNEGVEVLLLVDVSKSMLAEDIKPNRLTVAKRELSRLVDMSTGDRFSVVAFAGSAVLLSPMTTDREAVKMYLESLSSNTVSSQGTDFSRALEIAGEAFKRGGLGEEEEVAVTRAVIIASDGEDHQEGAMKLAEELADKDIRIFSLAFGSEKGAPIPEKDSRGQNRGYVKDQSGKPVLTQLKPEALRAMAEKGEGSFHHFAFESDVVGEIRSNLEQLQKAKFNEGEMVTYEEKFQIFLFFGLLAACLYMFLGERKSRGRIWKGRFEVEAS